MDKTDIVLNRAKQRRCPVCGAEYRLEWKDKFKAADYNGRAVHICKGHYVVGENKGKDASEIPLPEMHI